MEVCNCDKMFVITVVKKVVNATKPWYEAGSRA